MGVTIGIKKIEYAPVAENGAPGTEFEEFKTLQDSLTFNPPSTTDVDINTDEDQEPIYSKSIPSGAQNFTFNIPDATLDQKAAFKGGTVTAGTTGSKYTPPTSSVNIKMTIRITPEEGNILTFNSCAIVANETGSLGKTNNLNLGVTATPGKPTDGTSPAYEEETPDYVEA